MSKFAKLSPYALIAAALLSSSCFVIDEAGSAMVRFTWETSQMQRGNIQEIIAGYEDVKSWYDYSYDAFDASDIPRYSGSYDIRHKIYSDRQPQDATRYKGVYLPISKGRYTAVCTVKDSKLNRVFDIVANYTVSVGEVGTVNYYEVAFDARDYLSGDSDDGWLWGDYGEDPYTAPLLQKTPAAGLVNKIERGGVTYYVFSRAAER